MSQNAVEKSIEPEDTPPTGAAAPAPSLSHVDAAGEVTMVDVSSKPTTERRAVARGRVTMRPETAALVREGRMAKGNVITTARLAGIMAAKRCANLIPLAHPLLLTNVSVDLRVETAQVTIEAAADTSWKTGVEMEALTAVSVAALTIYDMCKAVDRTMIIRDIRIVHKSGGKTIVDDDPCAEDDSFTV